MSHSKSIAQKFAALMMLLPVSTGIAFAAISGDRAMAQSVQGPLGQCIQDLRGAYIYGSDAADRCVNQLQSSPPSQTLGQCIQDLRLAYVYGSTAADRCQRLLAAQQQNSIQQQNSTQQQNRGSRAAQTSGRSRRTLTVNNSFGTTLYQLYLSPASSSDWGRDVLGNDTLDNGYYMNFTLNNSECVYDIKAVFEDGNVIEDQFDSCRYNTYNLN